VHENMVYFGNIEVMAVSCVCQHGFGIRRQLLSASRYSW